MPMPLSTHALRRFDRRLLAGLLAAAIVLTAMVGTGAQAADDSTGVVYIARGFDFPDALVGAVIAAMEGAPILTVRGPAEGDDIPPPTVAELVRLSPGEIVIFGGLAVVSQNVENQLGAFTDPPGNTRRLAGHDRFATAAEIARALPAKIANVAHADSADHATTAGDAETLGGKTADDFAPKPQTVTRYANCDAADFTPNSHEREYMLAPGTRDGVFGLLVRHQASPGIHQFYCSVDLPHGAVVTALKAHAYDALDDAHVGPCRLRRQPVPTGQQEMALTGTTGVEATPGWVELETTDIAHPVVDAANHTHHVWCSVGGTTNDIGLAGAIVTYEIIDVPATNP